MSIEYAVEMAASSIRLGRGVTREVGMDLAELQAKRVMVVTDANNGEVATGRERRAEPARQRHSI